MSIKAKCSVPHNQNKNSYNEWIHLDNAFMCDLFSDTRYIKMFILDEADEMLSRGFKDQIYDVFRTLNESIQVKKLTIFQEFML
jgi:hypothetical protein